MSASKFFRNFLAIPPMGVKESSCHQHRVKLHLNDDAKMHIIQGSTFSAPESKSKKETDDPLTTAHVTHQHQRKYLESSFGGVEEKGRVQVNTTSRWKEVKNESMSEYEHKISASAESVTTDVGPVEFTCQQAMTFESLKGCKTEEELEEVTASIGVFDELFQNYMNTRNVTGKMDDLEDRLTCLNAEQQEHLDDLQVDANRDDVTSSAGYHFDIIIDTSLRIRHEPVTISGDEYRSVTHSDIFKEFDCQDIEEQTHKDECQEVIRPIAAEVDNLVASPDIRFPFPSEIKLNENDEVQERANQQHFLSCTAPLDQLSDNSWNLVTDNHAFRLGDLTVQGVLNFTKESSVSAATNSDYKQSSSKSEPRRLLENRVHSQGKVAIVSESNVSRTMKRTSDQNEGRDYSSVIKKRKRISVAAGVVYEDEVSSAEMSKCSTMTQTLLASNHSEYANKVRSSSSSLHGITSSESQKATSVNRGQQEHLNYVPLVSVSFPEATEKLISFRDRLVVEQTQNLKRVQRLSTAIEKADSPGISEGGNLIMGNGCDIQKQNANCGSNILKPAVINDEGSTSETTADGNVNPSTFDVERGDVESSAGSPSEKTKSASKNSKSEAAEASDDECSSIVSSNTEIYEDANCEDIEISEEETQHVVFERGVNDLPASVNVRLQVPSQSKLNKNSKTQDKTNQAHLLSLNNCTASVDPGAALVRISFDDLLASKDAQLQVLSQTKLNRNTAICWKSILKNAPTSRLTINSFTKLPFCAALVTDREFSSTADMDEPCVCVFCSKAVFVPDAQQQGQKEGFSSMFCYLCLDRLTHPEQRRFSCNICDMSFKATSHLLSHSKVHKREGLRISVMCYICKKVLTRAYAVKQHMNSHSDETFSFPDEKKVSSPDISQCSAMTTQALLSSDRSRVAKGASSSLASQGSNDRGEPVNFVKLPPGSALVSDRGIYRIKNEENPFACGFCSKIFRKKNYVRAHIIQRHEERRYSCEICGKRFPKQGDLSTHVMIHTQEKPFACDQCGMRFRLQSFLRRHKFSHSEERSYSCNKCNKSFKTSCVLATHKQSHNKDDRGGKGIICNICKRVFSNRNTLKHHMMTHTGEKRFKCTLCDKQYRQKIGLQNHMNTHSGKKWHKNELCSLCGKTVTAYYMPVHMRMHSGENPFECSICFKRFPKKQNLEGHMRSHTGEKPFSCSGCDKRFALYSNMVTHKRKCVTISENRA